MSADVIKVTIQDGDNVETIELPRDARQLVCVARQLAEALAEAQRTKTKEEGLA